MFAKSISASISRVNGGDFGRLARAEKIELGLPDSAWVFVTLEIELAVTIGGVMREIGS